ncbi:MAG: hypothetical protein Q9176_000370 [Flavoplaca citrina]
MSSAASAVLIGVPKQDSCDGVLVTRSGRQVSRKPPLRHQFFPFFRLPPEIRNMIYRFALAQGAISKACTHPMGSIAITNRRLRSHRSRTVRNKRRLRSSYETMNSIFCWECEEYHDRDLITATYSLVPSQTLPTIAILAVSRQVRLEAVPIFYGENIFNFYGVGAVVPFLKGCSSYSRQHIRHLGIQFDVIDNSEKLHQHQVDERAVTFAYVSRRLKLSKLSLYVNDETYRFEEALTSIMRDEEWIQAAKQVHDLDELGLFLDFGGIEGYGEQFFSLSLPFGQHLSLDEASERWKDIQEWQMDTENGYRKYLKSKMLKKKQTQLDRWLKRHICNVQCKDVAKGRAATKDGLPWSDTRGHWTLPDVDLEALFAGTAPEIDDMDIHDWSDEDSETTEQEDETEVHTLESNHLEREVPTAQQS